MEGHQKFLRGGGVLKAKISEANYKAKLLYQLSVHVIATILKIIFSSDQEIIGDHMETNLKKINISSFHLNGHLLGFCPQKQKHLTSF